MVLICCVLLVSCDHKDLCYMHPHTTRLKVVYDWSNAPGATAAGMCAFFYSVDRPGEYHRFDFPGARGGYIEIPQGNYALITYNNDTEAVQFSSIDKYDNHTATTRTGDILEPMYGSSVKSNVREAGDERVVITPDSLWGCHSTQIYIGDHTVTYVHSRVGDDGAAVTDSVITLYPADLLCHYSYEVLNVKNAGHINQVSGALSGMSPSMNLSTDALDPEKVTLPVSAKVNRSQGTITGNFLTFGHNPANGATHKMSFYVVMDDGSKYIYKDASNLDVTDQVDKAPDQRNVHIVIDGLDLPTPITGDSGFGTSVDDWLVKDEDLDI